MDRRPFITVLYDGECPLCRREAMAMRKLDRGRGVLAVEDAADPEFDPAKYGLTLAEVMGVIHGVMADGTVVRELEVFRRAYGAVGWGWLWAPTGWPVVKPIFDRLYLWFARNRLRFTFRSTKACETGRCKLPGAARG